VKQNWSSKRLALVVAISFGPGIVLTVLATFVLTGSLRELSTAIGASMLYILPAIALAAAIEAPMRRWMAPARFPMNWVIFVGARIVMSVAATAVGNFLMLLTRVVNSQSQLFTIDRLVIVMTVLISCGIELYASTRHRLEDRNRQLAAKVEAGERALQVQQEDFERAREIQQALMPRELPRIQGCELAAGCQPARVVGGDYFDAIRLGDARAAIAIGDVSGKGMAAALLMSNLQAIVRAFAHSNLAPHELCAKANQLIAGNVAPGKFITFFYAVIDSVHMRIDYCNAGHNPPILRRRDGSLERLGDGGPVLGVLPAARYNAGSAELRSGDCLVLYTDGISEAFNAANEEFGEDRLIDPLAKPAASAEERRRRIMVEVTEFSNGNFHDDATLLIAAMD